MKSLRRGVQVERSYSIRTDYLTRGIGTVVTILILFQRSTHTNYQETVEQATLSVQDRQS